MKNQILDLINNKPKHYSKIIKNSPELLTWVTTHSLVQSEKLAEMIYSAINQIGNICENKKIKHFGSFREGYRGCGPAALCACTAKKTSDSVTNSKKDVSKEQQQLINNKRRSTNLKKYGVTCVAQTEENKKKFQEYYADPIKVAQTLQKIRDTYIKKYGVTNCRQLPEVEEKRLATLLTKYNVTNISQIPSTKAKLSARMAEYKLNKHLIKKGYDRFSEYINTNYNFTIKTSKSEYQGIDAHQFLTFECNACNQEIVKKFSYGAGLNCETCNPKTAQFVSGEEQEIFDFITALGIQGYQGDRSIIKPYELDMVFPAQKIAVEYCGLYWHSEASSGKNKLYHANKMKLTNEQGYRLITIFSDEWNYKKDIVMSKLRNIFGQTSVKHYARKLVVKVLDQADSKRFLNQHHLQGHSVAKINLGLFTKDQQLVALMSFSNGRKALNSTVVSTEYELVRFVTNGDSIVGGAGKLLSYFIKSYNPTKIVSYADLRWSEGNLYKTLGFFEQNIATIGYWYVSEYKKREHRFNFTKRRLLNEGGDMNKTEWEIMQELGYDKIWDCGHKKYILEINQRKHEAYCESNL